MRGSASRSSRPSTPNAAARSSSRWSRSAVASASSRPRWDGWWRAGSGWRACRAGSSAPRRAPAGGPARTCRPTGWTGAGHPRARARRSRNDEVEAHVVTDDHRACRRTRRARRARRRSRGAGSTMACGDAGEDGDLGRDGHARVDQRLERAEALAAPDLDRADLGDPHGRRWPPVVSRSTTQNVTSESGVPRSSNVRCTARRYGEQAFESKNTCSIRQRSQYDAARGGDPLSLHCVRQPHPVRRGHQPADECVPPLHSGWRADDRG